MVYFYMFYIYFILILLPCHHHILLLQKVAIKGFELGPCHMIRICLMHSTAEPTSSITAWIVHHIDSTFPNHSISFSRTSKTVQLHLHNMTVMTTMMGHDNTLGKVENTFLYFFFTFFHFFVKKVEKVKKRKVL